MNPERFDGLVLLLGLAPSRRGLLRGLGVGTLTMGLTALGPSHGADAASKGKKGKRKRRAAREARGCTVNDPYATNCPKSSNPDHYCWVTLGGKPFCGTGVQCFDCSSNAHCVQQFGNPSARCVVTPEGCSAQFNYRSCVVYP